MRGKALCVAVLVLLISSVYGGPGTLIYQGNVSKTDGTAIPDGAYPMRFTIYGVEMGGASLWQETDSNVSVTKGLFSTTLGDGTAFGTLFADHANLWLTIEIDANRSGTFASDELYAPRQKMAGAPWAADADRLQGNNANYFQRRVTGAAPTGQFIRAINADGSVVTAADQVGSGGSTGWSLTGNTGTTAGTHFLGTTDYVPLDFRIRNARALRLEPTNSIPNIIGGYSANSATAGTIGAFVGGGGAAGLTNRVTDDYGTVGGGRNNQAGNNLAPTNDRIAATVGGGRDNSARNESATVAGGSNNWAAGKASAILGGADNVSSGSYAAVAGGKSNSAAANYSFAAGWRAKANHIGSFVWADATNADFISTGINQFLIRAANGVGIGLNNPSAPLHVAGNIKSNGDYQYGSARTFYKQVPTAAFTVRYSADDDPYWNSENGYINSHSTLGNGEIEFVAPVDLPHGAVVQNIRFYYYDNNSVTEFVFTAKMRRRSVGSTTVEDMASVSVTTANSTAIQAAIDNSISFSTIDNAQYQYLLYWVITHFDGPDERLYGARIEYTLNTLKP